MCQIKNISLGWAFAGGDPQSLAVDGTDNSAVSTNSKYNSLDFK